MKRSYDLIDLVGETGGGEGGGVLSHTYLPIANSFYF